MLFDITPIRGRRPKPSKERSRDSVAKRLAAGGRRKTFILPADVDEDAKALMARHGVNFTELVASLVRTAQAARHGIAATLIEHAPGPEADRTALRLLDNYEETGLCLGAIDDEDKIAAAAALRGLERRGLARVVRREEVLFYALTDEGRSALDG